MKKASESAGLNDAQLIEKIKEGSNTAMELLMERHNSHLKICLHAVLRNSTWEEDALQTLWMKVVIAVRNNRYHECGLLTHWLNRMARTVALNILRCEHPYLHDDKKLLSVSQPSLLFRDSVVSFNECNFLFHFAKNKL